MLPRLYRLKKKKEIDAVLKGGNIFTHKGFILKIRENDLHRSRFAFIVGRKVVRKAFLRNKMKRILREVVRKNIRFFKKDADGVIIVQKAGNVSFQTIENAVNDLLRRSRLL